MTHLDLFSGIGGFSLAFDTVFHEQKNKHIFCEIDPFCQAVLKKHWPESDIISNIRDFANSEIVGKQQLAMERKQDKKADVTGRDYFLLTGGFPCQPFSQAGRRDGTKDDRHLWPEMLRVIQSTKPQWVIAENVRGILTIEQGMVFEQVCLDLESEGYSVQPIIIPAVAVNAPHRRDRVWFIAHRRRQYGSKGRDERMETSKTKRTPRKPNSERCGEDVTNTECTGYEGQVNQTGQGARHHRGTQSPDWTANWLEVASELCRVDDGIPKRMDRNSRLKALGNSIVPQVAIEIMKAIKLTI